MGRMAEVVGKKNEQQQRAEDLRFLQYATEKDRQAEEKEKKKKEEAHQRDLDVRKTLARQMEERRKQRADELQHNKKYVQMVIDNDNKHK